MFFSLTKNDISPALTRMIKAVNPPNRRRVLRAMGTTFKSITEGTFNSVGAGYRPAPWAAKSDGSPSILQKSTTLAKSFNLDVDDNLARVSNPTKYANVHQFGATIKGNPLLKFKIGDQWISASQGVISPRPCFPVLNGKLTPKAEEKISAAARRVLNTIATGK
jgi:phage virion morphogenesis protein